MNFKARILIVENDGIIVKDIENVLEKFGYAVSAVVSSGERALQAAEEMIPNLVISEIALDGRLDGIEAAHQIYTRFNIPVIFLTATSDINTIKRAKLAEPYGFIIKPFEENTLHAAVEMALYKHGLEMSKSKEENSSPQKPIETTKVKTSEFGLQADWTRATFIVKKEHLEKIKALAYWDRRKVKDIVDEALESYLMSKNIEPLKEMQGK